MMKEHLESNAEFQIKKSFFWYVIYFSTKVLTCASPSPY